MTVIFFVAVIVRGILSVYILEYPSRIVQPDSKMYIALSRGIRLHGSFSYPNTSEKPDVERVPGYSIILALVSTLWAEDLMPIVILQVFLDSMSCVLIYRLSENLWKGSGWIGGLLAAVNIGMVTYCHFILNDSLFLFVFLMLILAMQHFMRNPAWKWSMFAGAGIGLAAYIRPVIIYFPLFIIPFFFLYLIMNEKGSLVSALGKAGLVGLVFLISLLPWLARNHFHYGHYRLTAQGGEHLLQYIVPFAWQYSRGIPFIEGMKEANAIFDKKMERDGIDQKKLGPFEKSNLQIQMAKEILSQESKSAIIRAWIFGMVKNLFAPAIIDMSYLLGIGRPHFFYTEGKTLIERGWNFIRGIQGFFGWVVIVSIVGMIVSRVLQVWGLIVLFRRKKWEAFLCLLIILYFLLVSGPVGYAKYRLPFEPILIFLMAISLRDLWGKIVTRKK